uniref:ribosomal protein S14 n=1 Tax=Gayralia brasiliensis TaxID=1286870 RepID=UPI0024114DC6|nr:ribosomal protein S14 [Gayralia brasiliensis]YP_010733814.1 ribosomal protein S14 [Monostroma nitidum]WEG93056.1 ribosomal protein S14 [Gayralia brasiliensis]WEG93085.1 ribosomal protein S14 [Monostroma nitidum]
MPKFKYLDLQFREQITDAKRRKKYAEKELDSMVLKAVLETAYYQKKPQKILAENRLQKLKNNTLTRIRNRCVVTGRNATLQGCPLSRISFREHASSGKLIGISKRLNK